MHYLPMTALTNKVSKKGVFTACRFLKNDQNKVDFPEVKVSS